MTSLARTLLKAVLAALMLLAVGAPAFAEIGCVDGRTQSVSQLDQGERGYSIVSPASENEDQGDPAKSYFLNINIKLSIKTNKVVRLNGWFDSGSP